MLKALSLLQPWASLAVMGYKTIETRSWTTSYRGILLIHASKGKGGATIAELPSIKIYIPEFKALPFGAIIGEVCLKEIVRVADLNLLQEVLDRMSLEERAFGNAHGARFGWIFQDPVIYDPVIPAKGALGLWDAG